MYSDLTSAIRAIMVSHRTIKSRSELKQRTHLVPVLDNVTRWSSKFEIIKIYFLINEYIYDLVPVELQLSPRQSTEVEILLKKLGQLEQLTKFLQSKKAQMHEVRILFVQSRVHCLIVSQSIVLPIQELFLIDPSNPLSVRFCIIK